MGRALDARFGEPLAGTRQLGAGKRFALLWGLGVQVAFGIGDLFGDLIDVERGRALEQVDVLDPPPSGDGLRRGERKARFGPRPGCQDQEVVDLSGTRIVGVRDALAGQQPGERPLQSFGSAAWFFGWRPSSLMAF